MCLKKTSTSDIDLYRRHKKSEPIEVWKIVALSVNKENGETIIRSPFYLGQGYRWKKGLNKSNRQTRLLGLQDTRSSVHLGFHCFECKSNAMALLNSLVAGVTCWNLRSDYYEKSQFRIMKAYVDSKDVVAVGKWSEFIDREQPEIIVCSQLTVYDLPEHRN